MSGKGWNGPLERIDDSRLRIPTSYKSCMRVPGFIYCSRQLETKLQEDNAPEQVANVACLPGIIDGSFAMPDVHWGYGFPIGGVAAFDEMTGVISPGGVGYDINCGVRLVRTDLQAHDVKRFIPKLVEKLFANVPSGVGSEGRYTVSKREFPDVLENGSAWAVKVGFGLPEDLNNIEDFGAMQGANPDAISREAYSRGTPQLGTLGAGNHFLEIQEVSEIFDEHTADAFGLSKGQLTVLIHTGSRGFGHQVATDYIEIMQKAAIKYGIQLPDKQLACAPFNSPEGSRYFGAMVAAANYAWANRQMITHWVRESLTQTLGLSLQKIGAALVYDVAHNIAKREIHGDRRLIVHRKGATRAFPSGFPGLPDAFASTGHPVLVPGDMGRYSFVMVGTQRGAIEVFASCCHGAGRMLSRTEALRRFKAPELYKSFERDDISVKAKSNETLAEEAPGAYKDVALVVDVLSRAGIAKKVARMKPLGVVKG